MQTFSSTSVTLLPRVHFPLPLYSLPPSPLFSHSQFNYHSLLNSFLFKQIRRSPPPSMAEQYPRGYQQQQQQQIQSHPTEAIKSLLPQQGPSKSQILAVVTLFPVGGALLCLAGLTLVGTLIGLAVATPVFLLFSPVLVPAALTIALAVTGFLTSGAFGITALSSLSWMINYMRRMRGTAGEQMEQAKRRVQEATGQMGPKIGQKETTRIQ